MWLFSGIIYDLFKAHGCSNSWGKSTASGAKMEQLSALLLIGKSRAVDNMVSCFEVDILRVVSVDAEP